MDFDIDFFEDLPQNCPPSNAKIPDDEIYFRLTDSFPPSIKDFYSHKRLFPNRNYKDECIARAISLLKTAKECEKKKKLPYFKNKNKCVIKVTLNKASGVVKKTGRKHVSWWMSLGFNPIEYCELVENA